MHHTIFGHPFAVLVAPIFLGMIAVNFINGVRRNIEDADTGESGSSAAPTETNFGASSTAPAATSNSPSETNSSASSSSTTPTVTNYGTPNLSTMPIGDRYHVFLNFRGTDTRDMFTSHLYNGLVSAGIRTFLDDNELHPGQEIGPNLWAAIKNSKILIPIFSENYCSSNWCLDEIVHIMECKNDNGGHIVLPIFYRVEPTHVKHQTGSFEAAFKEYKKHIDPTILEKRRRALQEVGNLKGFTVNRDEGKQVKLIVQDVLSHLKKEFELTLPVFLVGIDGHVKKVMKHMEYNAGATLFVGIYGMGGIGKTTLAKTIYNKLSSKFSHRSYIADIRESCPQGIHKLQNNLIFDISGQKNQVHNKYQGIAFISSMFKHKKVLILLDDVNNYNQLEHLVGDHNWFCSGSRILITTRNKSILEKARVDYMYEHEEMDVSQSLILFSRHAFLRDVPQSEFKDLSHKVVSTTGGLPFSLEFLGSHLYRKDKRQWEAKIKSLREFPPVEVADKLRISYNELESEHKQMFLDIACFFNGTDGRMATYMWDTYKFPLGTDIEELKFMSLIKVGDNHELKMHDHLRDLGRKIVHEENHFKPECRSRLWDSSEILEVLQKDKGTDQIQAIYLSEHSPGGSGRTANRGGRIHSANQFKKLTSLRLLYVSGALFEGDFENSINELRCLQWQECPSTFRAENFPVQKLAGLDLSRSNISENWQGWRSIMNAENLKFLDLTSCESLESTIFLSAFKRLEVLILRDCEKVADIDSSIEEIESLICLDLRGCKRLTELPPEVGKLEALTELLLKHNENISEVPDNIVHLQHLEILNLSGTGIKEFPYGIRELINLRDLDASRCTKFEGNMPKSICNLSSLQHLDLDDCKFLETLDVSRFNHLKTLSARRCKSMVEIRGLKNLKDLESLRITESTSIERLDLPDSKSLKILDAINCVNLVEIQGLDGLEFLEELYISWCASIERLDLPNSYGLNKLNIRCCNKLIVIQGLDRLKFLESLFVIECGSIEMLNLPKSKDLKILQVENCKNLVEIQDLDGLEFLEKLCIFGCNSIGRLNVPICKCQEMLNIKVCKKVS